MTKHYFQSGLLTKQNLIEIQQRVYSVQILAATGRIPKKIATGYSSFTADQSKNCTLIYNTIAFKNILDDSHYKIWLIFVKAVMLLTRKVLMREHLQKADALLEKFCVQVEHSASLTCTCVYISRNVWRTLNPYIPSGATASRGKPNFQPWC